MRITYLLRGPLLVLVPVSVKAIGIVGVRAIVTGAGRYFLYIFAFSRLNIVSLIKNNTFDTLLFFFLLFISLFLIFQRISQMS